MARWKAKDIPDKLAERIDADNRSDEIKFIENILKDYDYEKEYRFHDVRMFRLDYYIPALKVGVEYEGIIARKSRHTTVKGYSKDCIKYNLAQMHGITVLRYTALNYQRLEKDLKTITDE